MISVSLATGCYCHIRIGANATLYKLHQAILNAFDFEDDHQHAFFMDNHVWSPVDAYYSSKMDGWERLTKKYTLKRVKLEKGKKFTYLFDFVDKWVFQCKVLQELEEKTDIPGIIRSVGESPEQYPEYEEDDDLLPEEMTEQEIKPKWDLELFCKQFQNLNNTTFKHANRGYTPEEMLAQSKQGQKLTLRNAPPEQMSLFDVGETNLRQTVTGAPARNAPCPCGRKYKN